MCSYLLFAKSAHIAYTAFMFTARKVAQMTAVFAEKQGGAINILKLIKLLYLSDRESLNQHGMPISFDHPMSMDKGPMLSKTLDLINGFVGGSDAAKWEEWISYRDNYNVSVTRQFTREDLDELSDIDLDVLLATWHRFGKLDQWELVEYTHKYCTEWKDPQGSSYPIKDSEILIAMGAPEADALALSEDIQAQRNLDRILAHL